MATDNTTLPTGSGGDIISTDVVTTLNGSTIATGEKAQRTKVGWGVDGTFNDTNTSNPLPVVQTGTPGLSTNAAQETGGNLATIVTNTTGAATAAKQPALGTAGTPSTDVITVQGSASGTPQPVSTTTVDIFPATQNITAQDVATSTVAGFQGQSYVIGNPTANSAATYTLGGIQTAAIQITGIWTGTLRIEASVDGGTTYSSKFSRLPGTVYAGSSAPTSNCLLLAAVSNYNRLRIRASATWTGTATITVSESTNEHIVDVLNPIRLLDSTTSTLMTIKAASTAAVATDTSIVMALNPGTPLPAGTNLMGKVGIDQTTPGTTNAVSANQGTAAVLTGGWPTINGEAGDVTGTFTNATQTTSVTANNLDGYGNTLISINGTYGTATAIFEGSDDGGTTWYTVQAARDNTNVIETGYTTLTNISQTWQINNPGFDSLRIRSTAVASGTVNVRLSSSAAPVASGTIIGLGTSIPTGTNVIGHIIADTGSTTAVTGTVATAEVAPTTVANGKTTVTTAGTRVVLASSTAVKSVSIKALATNTGTIYIGSSSVSSSNGFQLAAGDTVSLDIANLNTVNIDSSVNGEGVSYLGVN